MTEHHLFEILLKKYEKKKDFPKQQLDCVNFIAQNITDYLYDSLKVKSSSNSARRGNVLKFLNHILQTNEIHSKDDNNLCYLRVVKELHGKKHSDIEVERFLTECNKQKESEDLLHQIVSFYARKNEVKQDLNRQLDLIRKQDEEKLKCPIQKKFMYYPTNQETIKKLLASKAKVENNKSSKDFRLSRIKLAYALTSMLHVDNSMQLLMHILKEIASSDEINTLESNFLVYLWSHLSVEHKDLLEKLVNEFPFTFEKIILEFCSEIIQLENANEVNEFFDNLLKQPSFKNISYFCTINKPFCDKIKVMINELYFRSYCNSNLLTFLNFLNTF